MTEVSDHFLRVRLETVLYRLETVLYRLETVLYRLETVLYTDRYLIKGALFDVAVYKSNGRGCQV